MSGEGFYPQYYLKKRKRDEFYGRLTRISLLIVTVIAGCGVGFLLWRQVVVPYRTAPDDRSGMAGEKNELETLEKLELAASQPVTGDLASASALMKSELDLSKLSYVLSYPQVHVSIDGATEGTSDSRMPVVDGQAEAITAAQETSAQHPAEQPAAGAAESNEGTTVDSKSSGEKRAAAEESKAKVEKPAQSEAKQQPNKQKEEEQPAKPAGEKPANPPAAGKNVFRVYAGSYYDAEKAEKCKAELSAIGLSGSVVKSGGELLVLVAALNDGDAAAALRNKLVGSGFSSSFVTRKKE